MRRGGPQPSEFAGRTPTPCRFAAAGATDPAAVRGVVARIARLAVHDGPGIRTAVFLKGCPLRCCWCSSPETQRFEAELLFDSRRCIRCGACIDACPHGAVSRRKDGAIVIDRSICEGCGRCTTACASGARRVVGRMVAPAEILAEIEKDEVFYYRSGGGVTISGGEPLAQPAFTGAILNACTQRGIHTAMETSACAPWPQMVPLLEWLRLVFVDIKHMDDDAHRRYTGLGNRLILDNIRRLIETRRLPVIIRVPVIPGVNDSAANMQQTADYVRHLRRIQRVELLPFHRYGLHHYEAIGRFCETAALAAPSQQHLRRLAAIFESRGIPVQIGG